MSEITTLDALTKLIVGQMIGGAASSADAANEIIARTDTEETDFGKITDSIVASSDLAGIAAGNIQIFQQFCLRRVKRELWLRDLRLGLELLEWSRTSWQWVTLPWSKGMTKPKRVPLSVPLEVYC
ncbi:hypothetical protein NYP20_17080 [Pseudomonas sp. N3-W]|jgi:hypothetical protein|uniref:Uncharacterized protein n=1 Tax=Pseudomonas fungipugnans TaxID=3024217 RepID=A0ABT6QIN2_9PSED|nr:MULTISPECIES: hypothetical protein [unclassified Pseudomonas]MDI2590616.1 hypothetical protein [Pseudomonas sp. 681]UWF47060.1 hypothetical protein NYP20_17080 [Pseudomonas sp. N3-W]